MNELNNMNKGLIAKASISINTPAAKVWEVLTTPELIKHWFFGVDTAKWIGKWAAPWSTKVCGRANHMKTRG
jgi:uncharacterized protein YndB with AHSA1/START domain